MHKTDTKILSFRVPPELKKTLEEIAAAECRTISGQVVHFLAQALEMRARSRRRAGGTR